MFQHLTNLQIKSLSECGRFAGYASVFDVVDSQQDVIARGAFLRSIRGREGQIKLLWQHQFSEPVGIITKLFEDAHGLYVEGTLLMDVARSKEVYALIKSRAINGLSIGYTPVHYSLDADTGVRKLTEVNLWEISFVTFPANAAAMVTVVKSADESAEWNTARDTGQLVALCEALERAEAVLVSRASNARS